jgi:hypothetical protein
MAMDATKQSSVIEDRNPPAMSRLYSTDVATQDEKTGGSPHSAAEIVMEL